MALKGQKFNKYSAEIKNIILEELKMGIRVDFCLENIIYLRKLYQLGNKNYGIRKNILIKVKSAED